MEGKSVFFIIIIIRIVIFDFFARASWHNKYLCDYSAKKFRFFLVKLLFFCSKVTWIKKNCEKLTSLSEWISTVGCAVLWWWSACVGVDCNDGDAIVTGAVDVWLLVWVACELLCCWPADDGVLLTGCCCFFFNAS